jgi:RHS repeat-associated protein
LTSITLATHTVNGQKTTFLNDPNQAYDQVLEEYAQSGVLAATYIRGIDLLFEDQAGARSYYATDNLGSTRALTNSVGAVTDTYKYDAYGNTIPGTGNTANPYLFTGQWFDAAIGQYYLRARDYNPVTSRFTSMDSFGAILGVPLSVNRFTYADDDSTNLADPSGLITGVNPYLVEAAIEAEYAADHPGQVVLYGNWTRLPGAFRAKPDIFNKSLHLYNEIKPLSWSGIALGVVQMALRAAQFGPASSTVPPYYPDLLWPATPAQPQVYRFITVQNDRILFFNAGGILFYTNIDEIARDTVLAAGTARSINAVRALLRRYGPQLAYASVRGTLVWARASIFAGANVESGQFESDVTIAGLNGILGAI